MMMDLGDAADVPLFDTLIATAVDGIVVIDERGTIQVFNRACEELFGYAPVDVLGQNIRTLMPEPYRTEHDGYLANYRTTGNKKIIGIGREVVGCRKDGSTFPMYLSVGEGQLNGKRIFVGIIHDLTSRDETRTRLANVQAELVHVSRISDMAQMVGALAHELNQPLAAIMNYMKAARRTIETGAAGSAGKAQELIDKAAEQTARAGKIIRNIRDFLEKRESIRTEEDVNSVVRDAIELGLAGAAHPDVKLRLELTAGAHKVFIDKVQIQQVVINLVRNSVDAMEQSEQRHLSVQTRANENGELIIAVSDSGPGLSPEVAERLFQPFVTSKAEGMGIGLSICRSIVESHNGRIWADANSPSGVTFRFTLPEANMD
jgi:two-component system sensor kinase FixL